MSMFCSVGSRPLIALALSLPLLACASQPPTTRYSPPEEEVAAAGELPDLTLYAYPQKGQTPEQLDRDRYECYRWAMKETGFDPSAAEVPPHRRVRVVTGPPPGAKVMAGAVTGAVIGAAVSNPWHAGDGALVGAVAGTVVGAVAASADDRERQRVEDDARRTERERAAAIERDAERYRRALGACLAGRGYTVR